MSRFRTISILALAIVILFVAAYAMQKISAHRSEVLKQQAMKSFDSAVSVRTGRVQRADILNTLTFNGDVEAMRKVELQPKVSGRLLSLELEDGTPVEEGVRVRKGMKLAQLDDREYHAQLSSAKAAKSAAEAAVSASEASLAQKKAAYLATQAATASSQANYDDKARELKRQENLVSKQASATQNLDLARTAFAQATADLKRCNADESAAEAAILSAEAAINQAKAALEQAQATLEQAQLNYDETRIYAPMDGIVSIKHIDPGTMVTTNTAIVTLVAMDTVKILLAIPVNHLGKVVAEQTHAALHPATAPEMSIECVVNKIYPSVDTATRTAQVEIRIDNPKNDTVRRRLLHDGMYATVDLLLDEHRNVVVVEQDLPTRVLDKNIVFVCDGDKVRAVPVKLGISSGNLVEVLEGLNEGDEVVVQGAHRLTDGSMIHRIAAPAASGSSKQ